MSEVRPSADTKRRVAERARDRCEYCHCPARFSTDPFSVEHIVPRSAGGTSEEFNLALSCQGCNNRKYTSAQATDPVTGEAVSLYNPRVHRWSG
jgi:5-methylcytosine-specific restriction endonuclease McrA